MWINLSGVFSSLDQFLNRNNQKVFNSIKLFDTATFPYACRASDNNEVTILGRKSVMAIAPLFPADEYYLNFLPSYCQPTSLIKEINSIKLGLMGTNAVFHPATMLFNARTMDNGESFLFYKEGISKNTALLHDALDYERLVLAKTLGYQLPTAVEGDNENYGFQFKDSYDFSLNSPVHANIRSPNTLNHRFIHEDIGYGLVPLTTLAKLYDVNLPNITSIITIFNTIMNKNYWETGRHLSHLTRRSIDNIINQSGMLRLTA